MRLLSISTTQCTGAWSTYQCVFAMLNCSPVHWMYFAMCLKRITYVHKFGWSPCALALNDVLFNILIQSPLDGWWISPNVCLSCASSTSQRTTTFESQGWLTTGHLQVSDVFVQRSVFKFNAIGSHWRQASPNNQPFSKLALQTSSMAFEHESNRKSWFFSADDGNHCVFNIWSTAEPFGPWH